MVHRSIEITLKKTGDGARRNGLHAELGRIADALHLDGAGLDRLDLGDELAESLGEVGVRVELRSELGRHGGHVDSVLDHACRQKRHYLLRDLRGYAILRLPGRGAKVRRDDGALVRDELRAGRGRLAHENVERDAADVAAV